MYITRRLCSVAYAKAVAMNLNKIIDVNYYPVPEAKNSNMKHRPIGIGGHKARAWSAVASPAVFEVRTTADSRGGGGPGRALRTQAQETRALAHFDFATHPNQSESPFRVD